MGGGRVGPRLYCDSPRQRHHHQGGSENQNLIFFSLKNCGKRKFAHLQNVFFKNLKQLPRMLLFPKPRYNTPSPHWFANHQRESFPKGWGDRKSYVRKGGGVSKSVRVRTSVDGPIRKVISWTVDVEHLKCTHNQITQLHFHANISYVRFSFYVT